MANNNLNTYSILFLIKGILTLLLMLFPILYMGFGGVLMGVIEAETDPDVPFNPGIIFIIIGGFFALLLAVLGVVTLLASGYLKKQIRYNFIFVAAILNALTGVLGILLCVFTLIELSKPEVKELFNKS